MGRIIHDIQGAANRCDAVDEARQRLEQTTFFRGRSGALQIDAQDGILTVRGSVPSYYLKQLLQATLRDIEGVTRVNNQVDVFWPSE